MKTRGVKRDNKEVGNTMKTNKTAKPSHKFKDEFYPGKPFQVALGLSPSIFVNNDKKKKR